MKTTVKDILALLKPTDEILLAWGDSMDKSRGFTPPTVRASSLDGE